MHLVGNSKRAAVCTLGIELNSGQFFLPLPEREIIFHEILGSTILLRLSFLVVEDRRRVAALQYRQITHTRPLCLENTRRTTLRRREGRSVSARKRIAIPRPFDAIIVFYSSTIRIYNLYRGDFYEIVKNNNEDTESSDSLIIVDARSSPSSSVNRPSRSSGIIELL